MPSCLTCGKGFADYKDLAHHIIENKKSHKSGRVWASKFLLRQQSLDNKATMQNKGRMPLTPEERENKYSTEREISGDIIISPAICPKCKGVYKYQFPVEYAESTQAWTIANNLVKLCPRCGGN